MLCVALARPDHRKSGHEREREREEKSWSRTSGDRRPVLRADSFYVLVIHFSLLFNLSVISISRFSCLFEVQRQAEEDRSLYSSGCVCACVLVLLLYTRRERERERERERGRNILVFMINNPFSIGRL